MFESLGKALVLLVVLYLATRFVSVSFSKGPWTRYLLNQVNSVAHQIMPSPHVSVR
jgi:hypothetical protein